RNHGPGKGELLPEMRARPGAHLPALWPGGGCGRLVLPEVRPLARQRRAVGNQSMKASGYLPAVLMLGAALASTEDSSLTSAVRLIDQDRLDEAEAVLTAVDRSDRNDWVVQYGRPSRHWIAAEYLEVIGRRRQGDRSDSLFRSVRFQFHLRGVLLSSEEAAR